MNACAVSDHVIAYGLRPGSPSNVILPEQLISVKRTDENQKAGNDSIRTNHRGGNRGGGGRETVHKVP